MWNLDSLQSLLRAVLKIGGGYLLAKGLADESALEAITAGVLALAAILWGVAHRSASAKQPKAPQPSTNHLQLPLLLVLAAALLTACTSANTVAFRAEKLATDAAYAGLLSWKAYYSAALTNTPADQLPTLTNRNEQIFAASRQFAATLRIADAIRETCLTNTATSNRTALQITLATAQAHSSNLLWLVRSFTSPLPEPPRP